MTDIIRLRDADGRVHHTARESQAAEKLLRDGAVDLDTPNDTPAIPDDSTPEVADAAPAGQGDDHDTGTTGGRSRKRERTTGTTDSGDGPAGAV
jgi:hypothetical protein